MKIQSDRILLRELEPSDAQSLLLIYSDLEAMKFRQSPPILTLEAAELSIEKAKQDLATLSCIRWAVIEKKTGVFMGTFVFTPKSSDTVEIGYSLGRAHWDKGYASELVALMLGYLRIQGYRQIEAWTVLENTASQRVLIKNNFVLKHRESGKFLFKHLNADESKSRISVLGCGWLGLPLAKHLVNLGFEVKGSTTTTAKLAVLEANGINPYLINLDEPVDPSTITSFLSNCQILIIAVPPRFKHANLAYHLQLKRLLPYMKQCAVERVFLSSSTSVYGCQSAVITEATPTAAESASGQQITAAEQLFCTQGDWKSSILRLGGLFGPDRHPVNFIAKKSEFENPDLSVNMVHLNDIIAFTTQLLLLEQADKNAIYNLVSPHHKSRKAFYQQAAVERGLQLPPETTTEWSLQKNVNGALIVQKTAIDYLF